MAEIRGVASSRRRTLAFVVLGGLSPYCLLPLPALSADASALQKVTVTTVEYRFIPKTLRFQHGVPYQLRIVNHGKEQHEFTAPDFFKTVDIADPDVLNADKTEIEIPPGMTKTLTFTPKQVGHYDLRCSDHDWAGMIGRIIVK
jgi:uncharacterized cupredoxin-like copper-binding protein